MRTTSLRRQDGFSLVDMLAAILVIGIVSAMALPATGSSLAAHRFRGDGQAVSNLLGLVKMRAAARFSRARLFVNLADNSYYMQTWTKPIGLTPGTWVTDGGVMQLSSGVTFGFGALTDAPPDTQPAIAMSPACRDNDLTVIDDTACIIFNSRGVPVDHEGIVMPQIYALYLTNGVGVYAVTITTTPLIRLWWSPATAVNWIEQQ